MKIVFLEQPIPLATYGFLDGAVTYKKLDDVTRSQPWSAAECGVRNECLFVVGREAEPACLCDGNRYSFASI